LWNARVDKTDLPINSLHQEYPEKHFMDFDFQLGNHSYKIATFRYPAAEGQPFKGVIAYFHGLNSHC